MRLASVLLVLSVVVAPLPARAQADAAPTLREIGRVRAVSPFCKAAVYEAAKASDRALAGNEQIVTIYQDLAKVDLDTNILKYAAGVERLTAQFAALRKTITEGEAAIDALRNRAKTSEIETERASLIAFADVLGGALGRQHKILRDLGGFLALINTQRPMPNNLYFTAAANFFEPSIQQSPGLLSYEAREAAVGLYAYLQPVYKDEWDASERVEPAFARCSGALAQPADPDGAPDPAIPLP